MDKIEKFLQKLSKKESLQVFETLDQLYRGKTKNLHIMKLKGHVDVYRVRTGSVRVVFRRKNSSIIILGISRRSEKTYKNFLN